MTPLNMRKFIFRNATSADLPAIVAIYNATIPAGMATADTEPVAVESRRDWFRQHDPGKRPLWVIEDDSGAICGWVSFQSFYGRPAYDATAEISLYIDETHRGEGLGKLALQYSIDHAPDFGVRTLLGFVFSHNTPSLGLFRRFGFQDWGTLPGIAVVKGRERGLKILGKRIG
jgi:phosphinothricin acetyltransferase